jgi:hypothetical protein
MGIPLVLGWSHGVAWLLGMAGCLGTLTIHDFATGELTRKQGAGGAGRKVA